MTIVYYTVGIARSTSNSQISLLFSFVVNGAAAVGRGEGGQAELVDQGGHAWLARAHPLTADVGCRNTLFNAVPQSAAEAIPQLLNAGVRDFRIELLDSAPSEVSSIISLYRSLLAGDISPQKVWSQLKASNRVGVTRGTLEERRDPMAIL